jgi:hypothetical protein
MFYLANCLFILLYVPFAYCLYLYPYYDLMVPESLNACAGATTNELPNATRGTPPPPPPPPPLMSIEKLLAMQKQLMRVLTENLV